MSLDIRYVTNGKKSVYRVIDSGAETFNVYETKEEIPQSIRHYAPDEPTYAGPGFAGWVGVQDILYPDFPKCEHPEYKGKNCIPEHCKFAYMKGNEFKGCPYFDNTYFN